MSENQNEQNNSPHHPKTTTSKWSNFCFLSSRKESGAADQFLENWGKQGVSRLESHWDEAGFRCRSLVSVGRKVIVNLPQGHLICTYKTLPSSSSKHHR
jgi:hypothetical protein